MITKSSSPLRVEVRHQLAAEDPKKPWVLLLTRGTSTAVGQWYSDKGAAQAAKAQLIHDDRERRKRGCP